jgi:hypothetical protein
MTVNANYRRSATTASVMARSCYEMRHRRSKGRRFVITGGTHRYASR